MQTRRAIVALALLVLLMPFSSSTCESDYLIWIPRNASAEALYRFTKGRQAGYIDQTGKIAIPLSLPYWGGNYGGEFHDGFAKVGVTEPDYSDAQGKKISFSSLFDAADFSEGLAAAVNTRDGQMGLHQHQRRVRHQPAFCFLFHGLRLVLRQRLRGHRSSRQIRLHRSLR
jgi:hypothetical protein